MKTRTGFVSNSSSSSFVISHTAGKLPKLTIKLEVDLEPYIEWACSTEEDLKKVFEQEYCGDEYEDPEIAKKFNKGLEAISQGKTVVRLRFSDECSSSEESFLYGIVERRLLESMPGVVVLMNGK